MIAVAMRATRRPSPGLAIPGSLVSSIAVVNQQAAVLSRHHGTYMETPPSGFQPTDAGSDMAMRSSCGGAIEFGFPEELMEIDCSSYRVWVTGARSGDATVRGAGVRRRGSAIDVPVAASRGQLQP